MSFQQNWSELWHREKIKKKISPTVQTSICCSDDKRDKSLIASKNLRNFVQLNVHIPFCLFPSFGILNIGDYLLFINCDYFTQTFINVTVIFIVAHVAMLHVLWLYLINHSFMHFAPERRIYFDRSYFFVWSLTLILTGINSQTKGTSVNHVVEGEGVSQMITLLHKPCLVKVSTKVGGGQKCPKYVHVVYDSSWSKITVHQNIQTGQFRKH